MNKEIKAKKSLKEYWDDRSVEWKLDVPLILNDEELEFQRSQLVPGGKTLILGATRELCVMASKIAESVTAVDFSQAVIDKLRQDGVTYVCQDWSQFFENTMEKYDNIMTDGGLLCLAFPQSWQNMADQIYDHLKPGGIFSAKVYVSTDKQPQQVYENPNLNRFVPSMAHLDKNWMVHPQNEAYKIYDMHYAFPPNEIVCQIFNKFELQNKLIPSYQEADRFVSYAWRRT